MADPLSALGKFMMKGQGIGRGLKRAGSGIADLVRGAEVQGPRMAGGSRLGGRSPVMQPGERFGGLFGDGGTWKHAKDAAEDMRDSYGMDDIKFRGPSALEKFLAGVKEHPGRAAAAAGTAAAGVGGALAAYRGLGDEQGDDDDELEAEYRRKMRRDEDPDGLLLNHRWD